MGKAYLWCRSNNPCNPSFVIAREKVHQLHRPSVLLNTSLTPLDINKRLSLTLSCGAAASYTPMAPNMRPIAAANLLSQVQLAGRRTYTTQRPSLIANRAQWTSRPTQCQIALRQAFRQQSTLPPLKPKRRLRTLLRWTWRLTYITAFAGLAYVGHGIYETRNPSDQPDPHPSKKTLVVLGG